MAAFKRRVAKSQIGLLKKEKSGPQQRVQAASQDQVLLTVPKRYIYMQHKTKEKADAPAMWS